MENKFTISAVLRVYHPLWFNVPVGLEQHAVHGK